MLRYVEAGLSDLEVPQEISLCIYLSGCIYRCEHCHYQDLQAPDGGNLLAENFEPLFLAYQAYMTCLCFLGEGSACDQHELLHYVEYAHAKNVKSCLYTGKEQLEDWMHNFDYVKIGKYLPQRGPLWSETTNQRMYVRHHEIWFPLKPAMFR